MNSKAEVALHERLHPAEARNLTIKLRQSCYGDDYDNPEIWGSFKHFESKDWKYALYLKDPEKYNKEVEAQINRLQEVVSPFIGKTAVGKTTNPAMKIEDNEIWEEWRMTAPLFAEGSILGVEGHPVLKRMFFSNGGPGSAATEIAPNLRWPGYRIGVVIGIDTPGSYVEHRMYTRDPNTDLSLPEVQQVLVTPRSFPASETMFHHLWSNQIQ